MWMGRSWHCTPETKCRSQIQVDAGVKPQLSLISRDAQFCVRQNGLNDLTSIIIVNFAIYETLMMYLFPMAVLRSGLLTSALGHSQSHEDSLRGGQACRAKGTCFFTLYLRPEDSNLPDGHHLDQAVPERTTARLRLIGKEVWGSEEETPIGKKEKWQEGRKESVTYFNPLPNESWIPTVIQGLFFF